jgi:hypothetical protein
VKISLSPNQPLVIRSSLTLPANALGPSLRSSITFTPENGGSEFKFPLNFVGGNRWLISEAIRPAPTEKDLLGKKFLPEKEKKSLQMKGNWTEAFFPDNAIDIEPRFGGHSGIIYLRHFVFSPEKRSVRIGVPTNGQMKLWVNGKKAHKTQKMVPLRPNYSGEGANYVNQTFKSGWNTVLIKLLRKDIPLEAHLTLAMANGHHGIADMNQSKFPWEK